MFNLLVPDSLSDHLHRLLAIKAISPTDQESSIIDESNENTKDINKLLSERDEIWREHEKSQIAFMEREHERVLNGLHMEIERLQIKCVGK